MKKVLLTITLIAFATISTLAQCYGITFDELEVTEENAADIFGDGLASYNPSQNMLTLQAGFDYHLSTNFVTINTGRDFIIRLEGDAAIYAAIECGDNLSIETARPFTLKITANISGSALKCPNLMVNDNVTLDLLSRNSSSELHALDCTGELIMNNAILTAEVTTARLAVAAQRMTLNGCWLQRPKGGSINPAEGGICFGDGTAAKIVRITTEGYGIEENEQLDEESQVLKCFENGQIVIIRNRQKYNVAGQRIF